MFEGREKELYTLTDEVLDWIESYRSPVAKRLNVSGLVIARARRAAAGGVPVRRRPRSRALGALVHLTLDERYAELSDPQIAQFAGISTEAFHKQFANKEACFLAVLDEFVAEAMEAVKRSIERRRRRGRRPCICAVRALVEYFAAHEALAASRSSTSSTSARG